MVDFKRPMGLNRVAYVCEYKTLSRHQHTHYPAIMSPGLLPHTEFPVELIEHAIDFLHVDSSALRHLALTCRALLPRSRYHLFNAIQFQPTVQDVDSLCDLFDTNPSLALLIHVVAVRSPRQLQSPQLFAEVLPARLLKRLRHVSHWKLFTGVHGSPEIPLSFHWTTLAFLKTANCIQTLDLKALTINSNVELARLLSSLPFLRVLRCSDVNARNRTTAVGLVYRQQHRSLKSVYVRMCVILSEQRRAHDEGGRLREVSNCQCYDCSWSSPVLRLCILRSATPKYSLMAVSMVRVYLLTPPCDLNVILDKTSGFTISLAWLL